MRVFYVRCSTMEQNEARQLKMAEEQNAEKVFVDKASGKNTNRAAFKEMMAFVRAGDTVVVESISRIARNTRDLLSIVSELTEKGVEFVSLKENIDTTTPQGRFILTVFGALNLNARNFDVELRRAVEKLENGMSGFLTQPVLSAQAVENLRKARQTLGERAKILAGIMPVVSQRNAIFMENEINGIHVEEDIIQRFASLDREQGEALGLEVSMQMARDALPYADGFYLMTPFNRVALMERLIARLKTELLDAEG